MSEKSSVLHIGFKRRNRKEENEDDKAESFFPGSRDPLQKRIRHVKPGQGGVAARPENLIGLAPRVDTTDLEGDEILLQVISEWKMQHQYRLPVKDVQEQVYEMLPPDKKATPDETTILQNLQQFDGDQQDRFLEWIELNEFPDLWKSDDESIAVIRLAGLVMWHRDL